MDEWKTYGRLRKHAEQSEKALEKYLTDQVKLREGMCLKYYNAGATGWPDRIVMMPGGIMAWVELKSKGEKPAPLQRLRLEWLRENGYIADVVDSREDIDGLVDRLDYHSRKATGREVEE